MRNVFRTNEIRALFMDPFEPWQNDSLCRSRALVSPFQSVILRVFQRNLRDVQIDSDKDTGNPWLSLLVVSFAPPRFPKRFCCFLRNGKIVNFAVSPP